MAKISKTSVAPRITAQVTQLADDADKVFRMLRDAASRLDVPLPMIGETRTNEDGLAAKIAHTAATVTAMKKLLVLIGEQI